MVTAVGSNGRRPAVFLDRDGVIVVPHFRDGRSFAPRRLEDFEIYAEAAEDLAMLKAAGYQLVVVTNQPDVGNGLIPAAVVDTMHDRLRARLPIDAIKVCMHGQAELCQCRKPSPRMIIEAAEELDIDLGRSVMVGDRASDVAAGAAAGCATIFIDLEYAELKPTGATHTVACLREAVNAILESGKGASVRGDGA